MRAYDGNYFCLFLYHFLNPSTVSLLQRSLMGLDADSMICSGVFLFQILPDRICRYVSGTEDLAQCLYKEDHQNHQH